MSDEHEDEDGRDELEQPEDESPASTDDTVHAPAPIRLGDRTFHVGTTGSGKSELALNLFSVHRGQRLLIDVQDHYILGPDALAEDPAPLDGIDDPSDIDWRSRTIRYVPRRIGDRKEMDRLHAAIFRRGRVLVVCDEAEDVAPSMGGGAPPFVRKCVKQGRKVSLTYIAATQRPAGVELSLRTEAEHLFAFPMDENNDLDTIRGRLGMTRQELTDALNQLGEYEYLRHTKGQLDEQRKPIVIAMPALPPEVIEFNRRHVINLASR